MEFTLASLWSRIPGVPLEEVLQGIVPRYDREVRGLVRGLAANVVAMFVPEAGDGAPAGGGDGPVVAEVSDTGQ